MNLLPNLVFSRASGQELTLDLFTPASAKNPPLVVCIHGGGWISGDKSMYHEEAEWLCYKGYAAACISYRLAPMYPFPAAVADVQAAVEFLQAAQHPGYDPTRLISFGNSAGGHLALMSAVATHRFDGQEAPAPQVQGVVSVSGISDMRDARKCHFDIGMTFLNQFLGDQYSDETAANASPIAYVLPSRAPFLLIHGENDDIVPVRESVEMHNALLAADVKSELILMPGEYHSFTYGAWSRIRTHLFEFLQQHFPHETH